LGEYSAKIPSGLVTDFVTLGNALTHAYFLMCLGKNQGDLERDFTRHVGERDFPTCPPKKLDGDGLLSFYNGNTKRKEFHHGAMFGLTRWTNIYFPLSQIFWGDAIGGPVAPLFGSHIVDVPVSTRTGGGPDFFTHTAYWDIGRPEGRNAPHIIDLYVNLASVSMAENRPDEAISFYNSALGIDGANFNSLRGLISIYAAQNKIDQAHARIDQALGAQPNNASLHFLKGQVYGFERNAQGAEAEFRRALEIDGNYLAAYSALGALFVNTNQQERAIQEYQKIVERRPENAAAYTLIGMLEMNRQNFDAAADYYRKALAKDENAVFAANNLAWLYAVYGKGNLDEAVRLAQSAVQASPEVPSFVDTLGWIYYKKGLYGAAAEQLKKAVSVDEEAARRSNSLPTPTYYFHLGVALAAKGDKASARKEIETALRLSEKTNFPEASEARKTLATL